MDSNQKKTNANEVSLFHLYALRALYLLIVIGLGIVQWPAVIHQLIYQEKSWELMEGVVACMLTAFSALSILGLRYPLQMMPLLMWEMLWKAIWLIIVAVPLWSTGQMDESTWSTASACLIILIFPFAIPWRFVFNNYVKKRGERWR